MDATSREGATVSLSGDGLTVTYDPSPSARLDSLAREEPLTDSFELTVTDDREGDVRSLVAVLVSGANDTPVAVDDSATTPEDQVLVIPSPGVVANDEDVDVDLSAPDNQLILLPVAGASRLP